MTVYYKILENDDNGKVYFTVKRAWIFLGILCSPGLSKWVGRNTSSDYLWPRDWAGHFCSLKDAQEAATIHADYTLEKMRKKSVKRKVVEVVKFN